MEDTTLIDKVKQWGAGAGQSLQTSATNIASGISNTTTMVSKKFGEAFSDASGLVKKETDNNSKPLATLAKTMQDAYGATDKYNLFPIGRTCKFNSNIDPSQRFSNYLRTKMSVIDLVPVDYSFDFNKMAKIVGLKEGDVTSESAGDIAKLFNISYETNIEVYRRICEYHGLSNKYAGIRLYTTDDTTANDTIQIGYKDSTLQHVTNAATEIGQSVKDLASSLFGSERAEFQKKVVAASETTARTLAERINTTPEVQQFLTGLTSVASDLIISGNKMTFPKIWQSTTYAGNLSVNIRLISPYGHPAAVKEFILKPLSYLILLAAPQTINGVTYGGSIPLTIKAYGLNHTVLGSLATITFRRGGSDTSFNLYHQPLTIDLSLEFQTLFDAFAVFDPGPPKNPSKPNISPTYDKNIFKDSSLIAPDQLGRFTYETGKLHLMTSLGTILSSLKPICLLDSVVDPHVYGFFETPSRDDIPDSPPFTPISGNLASAISGTVESVGKFGELITNAPALLQQGLANAIYNKAKDTVSSVTNSAAKYIDNVGEAASKVVNTIRGNLF